MDAELTLMRDSHEIGTGPRSRAVTLFLALSCATISLRAAGLDWAKTELVASPANGTGTVVVDFGFRNAGSKTVEIVSVRPSCDCLSAQTDKIRYAPGESGIVRAEFTLAGREGRQEKTIAVTTDDAPGKPTVLNLTVEIPEPVAVKPRFVFWRLGEATIEKEIEVVLAEPQTATLGDVLCAESAFSVRLVGAGTEGRYRVKITPTSTAKLVQTTIRLNATVAGQPRVFVLYAAVK